MTDDSPGKSPAKTPASQRHRRLADALRANLRKRKEQARGRVGSPDDDQQFPPANPSTGVKK